MTVTNAAYRLIKKVSEVSSQLLTRLVFFHCCKFDIFKAIGMQIGSNPASFMTNLLFSQMNLTGFWKLRRVTHRKQRNSSIDYALQMTFKLRTIILSLKKLLRYLSSRISIIKNSLNLKASLLDYNIDIRNKVFANALYDKRGVFLFSIVRMPHRDRFFMQQWI